MPLKKERAFYGVLTAALFVIELIITLFVRDSFIRPYGGDILFAAFMCAFIRIFFPKKLTLLPLYVFLFSTAVEILQYFDFVKLLGLHKILFFVILLGRSFSVFDIVCYAIGCLLFFFAELLAKRFLFKTSKE
ncbi:MAG: DUF2809 domain-containing protein [Clostridia bacterium]|nr:DUF2809 domain-containing protein [Clostridia bacterium]